MSLPEWVTRFDSKWIPMAYISISLAHSILQLRVEMCAFCLCWNGFNDGVVDINLNIPLIWLQLMYWRAAHLLIPCTRELIGTYFSATAAVLGNNSNKQNTGSRIETQSITPAGNITSGQHLAWDVIMLSFSGCKLVIWSNRTRFCCLFHGINMPGKYIIICYLVRLQQD